MIPAAEPSPQPGASDEPSTQPKPQMAGQVPAQPQTPGHPPAFGDGAGGAWVLRDLASI